MEQTAPTNLVPILIGGLLFLAAIIALSIWASRVRRQRTGSRQEALFALGFVPLEPPPAELRDRVAALQPHRSQGQVTLRSVYGRPIEGGQVYLFESIDAESDDVSFLTDGTLAIASKALRSPTFTALPRLETRGSLGLLMEGMLERAYAILADRGGLIRVSFPDDPEFEERFVVLAAEPGAAEAFLTAERRTALLTLPKDLVVAAHLDTLTLSAYARPGGMVNSEPGVDQIGARLELLQKLFQGLVTE